MIRDEIPWRSEIPVVGNSGLPVIRTQRLRYETSSLRRGSCPLPQLAADHQYMHSALSSPSSSSLSCERVPCIY